MKASAVAHTIQGLIKYHGLRDENRRLPFHDSISVCVKSLSTEATVGFDGQLNRDVLKVNGRDPTDRERMRVAAVVDSVRKAANTTTRCRIHSRNSLNKGKGLGFSASAFAAIGLAACHALGVNFSHQELSEIVRLGAGSATRSLAGGVAIWYANKHGRSYAEQLLPEDELDLRMVIVPIQADISTETAHKETVTSPLFKSRLRYLQRALREMKAAIRNRDTAEISRLTEIDTLNLHAVTMTGAHSLTLMKAETLRVIETVRRLREEGLVHAWFSMDTGPSVFINTNKHYLGTVKRAVERELGLPTIISEVGPAAHLTEHHLF